MHGDHHPAGDRISFPKILRDVLWVVD